MMKRIAKISRTSFLLVFASLYACGGGSGPQVSGVTKQLSFKTGTCVPQQKTLKIRNENTEEPQRIQGLLFEPGTNDFDEKGNKPESLSEGGTYFQYFKIDEVSVGGKIQKTLGNMSTEIILPPGGVMEVKVSYKPRVASKDDTAHQSYLDVLLNGPKLGVMQFELRGEAEADLEACAALGEVRKFNVKQVSLRIVDKDLAEQGGEISPDPLTNITELLQFTVDDNGNATMTNADFPTFYIPAPGFEDGVPAGLLGDATGTFNGGADLEFSDVTLSAGGIGVPGAKITTGSAKVENKDGSIEDSGSTLTNGQMTLLIVVPLNNSLLQELDGGVISAKLELEEVVQ